ncbi:MAG: single-stranded DNA-binding protein [Elusimicrobia bacterium]|jgi:single-strand DNA-binding protein|nr:single-stranded DNA-binding protein [Elusimicrobiota bacterium]
MANANLVVIMGNLTRKPELRSTQGGRSVTTLSVAVNRVYKDKNTGEKVENTDFIDVSVWGRQAETCEKYLSKGSGVYVEGRLNLRRWESQNGDPRSKLEVVARNVQFLSYGGSNKSNSGDNEDSYPKDETNPKGETKSQDTESEDIPF